MRIFTFENTAISRLFSRHETFALALALSFLVVALDQFLHTSPEQFGASPAFQAFRWLSDSLMALPLFVAAAWAGHLIADMMGLQMHMRGEIFGRALIISGSVALFLIPGWFAYIKLASLTQGTAPTSGHVHGASSNPDVYWVGERVVWALLLAPLAVAVGWFGYRTARRLASRHARAGALLVRTALIAAALGGAFTLAWFLHRAATRADSTLVYYTSALQFAHVHSHAFFAADHGAHLPPAGPSVTAAPFAFAYQVARAFQDGLIAQAVGLPIALLMLLFGARAVREHDRSPQEGSLIEEVANR